MSARDAWAGVSTSIADDERSERDAGSAADFQWAWLTMGRWNRRGLSLVPFTAVHFATLAAWFVSEREVVQWDGGAVRFPLDGEQLQAMTDESLTEPATR